MNSPGTAHLTEDQIAECLIGPPFAPEIAAHLSACDLCQAEIQGFSTAVKSFNAVSLAWSESRPYSSLRETARSRRSQPIFAMASFALAACLAIVVALSMLMHRDHRSLPAEPLVAAQEDSPAQIEQDNKLLLAVDQATTAEVASPAQVYGLDHAPKSHLRGQTMRSSVD